MSFALTTIQIKKGLKDVTRRRGWKFLNAGEYVRPVEKCMGLKKGEKVVQLCPPLKVKSVRFEPLKKMTDDLDYGFEECRREGFTGGPYIWPSAFVAWFCSTHKCKPEDEITRIEFERTE